MKEMRYRILKKLSEGGSAETYLVWDKRLEQHWVLKRIALQKEGQREAAMREMAALRQVHKEGIPVLVDMFYEDGAVCLILEYMTGVSLEEKIRRDGAMDEEEVVQCALQTAGLIHFLHTRPGRVIHGDIKPGNLMYHDGRAALLDFGGSAFLHTGAGDDGGFYYTPGYGAPELADGYGISVRTDIYAFGAVLFYMVTGEQPGATRGIYPVRERNPFLSERIESLILRCTQRDPSRRFGSMADVVRELEEMADAMWETKETGERFSRRSKDGRGAERNKRKIKGKMEKKRKKKKKEWIFRCIRDIVLTEGGRTVKRDGQGKICRAVALLAAGILSGVTGASGAPQAGEASGMSFGSVLSVCGRAWAAEEALPVCIRNKAGEKLLVAFDAVYYTDENPVFELPLKCFEEGKEYEVTITQQERGSRAVRERTFVICAD